jgi:predicted amidohydrolase
MKVTLLQTDVKWADPAANVEQVEQLLQTSPDADLYVLPEMWATGFATEPQSIAEQEEQSIALSWMKRTASQRGCALSGSLLVRTQDGSYRNRHYFVCEDGVSYYDKHHLFTFGHEDRFIKAGQTPVMVEYQDRIFLLLTCYDLRFPVWARYGRVGMYDAIIIVANWPERRQQAWNVLTRARAIENQCYLIGCNRVGDDQFCHYKGESVVCDSQGNTLLYSNDLPGAYTTEIDFEAQDAMRARFRVLDDRD